MRDSLNSALTAEPRSSDVVKEMDRVAAVDDVLTTIDAFGAALRAQDPTAAETVWSLDRAEVAILGQRPVSGSSVRMRFALA